MNKLYILLLVVLTLLSGTYLYKQSQSPEEIDYSKRFLSTSSSQLTLTYSFEMEIESVETTSDQNHTQENMVKTKSTAKFTPVYNPANNQFTVMVDYDNIEITKENPVLDSQTTTYVYQDSSEDVIEILYIAYIHADTGKIIRLEKTTGDSDPLVDQMTKIQIAQIFPDIRRGKAHLLQQANFIEETEIGFVEPTIEVFDEQDTTVMQKSYNENNIIGDHKLNWVQNANVEVQFSELLTADKDNLLVRKATQQFSFVYEIIKQNLLSEIEDDGTVDSQMDAVGDIEVYIETELDVIDIEYKPEYFDHINEIMTNMEEQPNYYEDVDIAMQQPDIYINDLSAEPADFIEGDLIEEEDIAPEVLAILKQSAPIYTKDYDVVNQRILGKNLKFQVQYRNYGETSNIQGVILLDSRVLKTLFSYTYKHCGGSKSVNNKQQYNMRIFTVKYPILGIITIDVSADFTAEYGFNFYYGPMSQAHGCEVSITPYILPGITVSGGVNAIVAQGGIYARGTIANTQLTFASYIKGFIPNLSGSVSLQVQIKPFKLSIGAWYKLFTCSFKKLFRWRPKLGKVCGYGNRKEIQVYSYGVGQVKTYNIFTKTWRM